MSDLPRFFDRGPVATDPRLHRMIAYDNNKARCILAIPWWSHTLLEFGLNFPTRATIHWSDTSLVCISHQKIYNSFTEAHAFCFYIVKLLNNVTRALVIRNSRFAHFTLHPSYYEINP